MTHPAESSLPHFLEIAAATARLLETVDRLSDDAVRAPSLLPGWTRAHVITHVARNADAFAHVLAGPLQGEVHPQYPSQAERDAGVEQGAARSPADLRHDLAAACLRFEEAARALPADRLDDLGARLPEGPTYPVRKVGMFRLTEVEVHHADLDADYTAHDWSSAFVERLMDRRRKELGTAGVALQWTPTDTGETWRPDGADPSSPEVTGAAADIVWWLLGRGSGEGLACSEGSLPRIGRWA